MNTNLAKWGNSAAIRIPKAVLEELNIDSNNFENISFDIDVEKNRIILNYNKLNNTNTTILETFSL